MRGGQCKTLNGYENIDRIFFSDKEEKRSRLDMKLH